MHRWKLWWVVVGLTVAVAGVGCRAGSNPGVAAGSTTGSSSVLGGVRSSAAVTTDPSASANHFSCPTANDINALTALLFTAASTNTVGDCQYVATRGTTSDTRITIEHPPAAATHAGQTLSEFKTFYAASKQVGIVAATQFSPQAFIARFGDHSCSVFALARDGQVMAVQATHRSSSPVNDCSLAQSVTAVIGTDHRSEPTSAAPSSRPSPAEASSSIGQTQPTATPESQPVTAPPRSSSRTVTPTNPPSRSEVLMFSTGPASSLALPTH